MKHDFRSITENLYDLHEIIRQEWPSLLRIAVALYDDKTGMLHTFVRSSPLITELEHYSIELEKVPSLKALSESGKARLINNLCDFEHSKQPHSQAIFSNFHSSYTEPFYLGDCLLGFVFYDATDVDYFSENLVKQLVSYTRLIESLIIAEVLPVKALIGLMETTQKITNVRDAETGQHLIRVASYIEVIALELSDQYSFTDEYIEYMWCYAPLHDIGKIAIPDRVLMKPDKLTKDEFTLMKTHVNEGMRMLDMIVENFYFQQVHHLDILQSVIGSHHERWDGSGYPEGLIGDNIPIVGRIMAVADVFDALSTDRVYRSAWSFEKVFSYLEENAGGLFDPECVSALSKHRNKVEKIATNFQD